MMRKLLISVLLAVLSVSSYAQGTSIEQEIKELSKAKWQWMADKDVDKLETAVLWNRITLMAHVRGNDVSNEFTVTEFYQKEEGNWKLLDLTFSSVRDTHKIEH